MGCCPTRTQKEDSEIRRNEIKQQLDSELLSYSPIQSSPIKSTLSEISALNLEILKQRQASTFHFTKKDLSPLLVADEASECPGCYFIYNSSREKPLNLPCGHTLCSKCCEKASSLSGKVKCKIDKKEFEYKDFPIAFSLLKKTGLVCKVHNKEFISYSLNDRGLHCIDCDKKDSLIQDGMEDWKREIQEYIKSLEKSHSEVLDTLSHISSLEEDIVNLSKKHIAGVAKKKKEYLRNLQEEHESYEAELNKFASDLQKSSLSNAIEQSICKINYELQKAQEAREFEDLSLIEKIEIAFPGPVMPAKCPEIDTSPYSEIKQALDAYNKPK